jgi:hypothetical protein
LFIWYAHERPDAIGDTATVIGLFSVATLASPVAVTWKSVPTARVAKVSLFGRVGFGDGWAWAGMKGRDATTHAKKITPNNMNNLDFFIFIPPLRFLFYNERNTFVTP